MHPAAHAFHITLYVCTYRLEGRPVAARSSTPQVVIVDDDSVQIDLICAMLADADITAEGSPFDKQAYAFIRHRHPAVVILDVMMTFTDGLSIYQLLRTDPATERIRVIFLTANPTIVVNAIPEYRDRGVHLLHKPVAAEDLIALVTALLGESKAA
jgi:CheY-like chemotaxis protein